MRHARAVRACACAAVASLAVGCATDDQLRRAINEVNEDFRIQYEGILAEKGSRVYKVRRDEAFSTLRTVTGRLGLRIADQAPDIGYLNVYAPAPIPLSQQEWGQAAQRDLPRLREIAARHVGFLARFVGFEPEGLDIVINATALDVREGTEISLTMRLRETAPPRSGMPRREYPPPTAVRMGLDKIWGELEREFKAAKAMRP